MLRWRADLAELPPVRWAVADQDERIAGFIGVRPSRHPVDPTLGEIDTIAVAPEAWRTGMGRALMGWGLDCLRSDGYRLAILWTLAHYSRGAGFYPALGWRLNGVTRRSGTQVRYDPDLRAGVMDGDS
jgi:GNAT superfamily N-acetyltransferase